MSNQFSQNQLDAFLDEGLPASEMSDIEEALRDDADLQEMLASAIGRRDAGIHSLGGIWRRRRLTCPSREELGSYLMNVVERERGEYIRFHIETVECRFCQANVEDLRSQHAEGGDVASSRRKKYFQSSADLLSD